MHGMHMLERSHHYLHTLTAQGCEWYAAAIGSLSCSAFQILVCCLVLVITWTSTAYHSTTFACLQCHDDCNTRRQTTSPFSFLVLFLSFPFLSFSFSIHNACLMSREAHGTRGAAASRELPLKGPELGGARQV